MSPIAPPVLEETPPAAPEMAPPVLEQEIPAAPEMEPPATVQTPPPEEEELEEEIEKPEEIIKKSASDLELRDHQRDANIIHVNIETKDDPRK